MISLFYFSKPSYTQTQQVLKMHHPCFFYRLFGHVDVDFRPGDGRACPFGFDGSGVALAGGMLCVRSICRYHNNRLVRASNFCRRKRGYGSSDRLHKSAARHLALKFAGSRAMVSMNFRLWWCKVQFSKSPELQFRAFPV
jgi:hypothetical protein